MLGIRQRAAIGRLEAVLRAHISAPPLVPGNNEGARLCAELDCLRGWLSEDTIAVAERRALTIGTGADRALIAAGMLDEELYVRALADALGISFEPLESVTRDACPLDDGGLLDAPAAGVLPLSIGGELKLAVAPRGIAARRLAELVGANPHLARLFRLSTSERLQAFVTREAEAAIAERATWRLAKAWPELSAAPPRSRPTYAMLVAATVVLLGLLLAVPRPMMLGCTLLLTMFFLAWSILRIAAALADPAEQPTPRRRPERELPVYTVLAPLYGEARSVGELVAALRRFDYPGIMAQTPQDNSTVAA